MTSFTWKTAISYWQKTAEILSFQHRQIIVRQIVQCPNQTDIAQRALTVAINEMLYTQYIGRYNSTSDKTAIVCFQDKLSKLELQSKPF